VVAWSVRADVLCAVSTPLFSSLRVCVSQVSPRRPANSLLALLRIVGTGQASSRANQLHLSRSTLTSRLWSATTRVRVPVSCRKRIGSEGSNERVRV
jgi:hypothetical protein